MAPTKRRIVDSTSLPPASERGPFAGFASGVRPARADEPPDEIDQAFERLESGAPPRGLSPASALTDLPAQSEHAALLRQIVIDQAQFLRERMRELASRRTEKRWVAATRFVLENLLKAMDALEPSTLGLHLATLDALLDGARKVRGAAVDEGTREALLSAHARVDAELARMFDVVFEPVLKARR